jgi:hypothetical protein
MAPVVIRGLRVFSGGIALVWRVRSAVVVSHDRVGVVMNQIIRRGKMKS